ncbi:bifunctional transcriptional activator/DNA repair enzyme AdaA [Paracoccaceae bacterium GXU_MW_L88]
MVSLMYDNDTLYTALLARDPAYDGFAFVGVHTTGIYCRLTCAARKPKRENISFYTTPAEAREAGLRPCKRCKPDAPTGEIDSLIPHLLERFAADPEGDWSDAALIAQGYDPATVRRKFKRHYGQTFQQTIRAQRVGRAQDRLASGEAMIEAQLDAGFGSASGFRDAFTRLTGQAPAKAQGETLRADWLETPLGPMMAVADETRLHLLEFHDRIALPTELKALQKKGFLIAHGRTDVTEEIAANLRAYFNGAPDPWTVAFAEHGSAYTRSVWAALREIPSGETRSYGEIAKALDQTGARAVARANGANQLALIIPCHRVIGGDGSLTGYGGKIWRKQWLIEHERRHAPAPKEPRLL